MTDKDCVCGRCKYHEIHKRISQGKKEVEAWYCNNTRSEYYMDYTMYLDTCDDYEARERIKDIPAVEPKHGEWKFQECTDEIYGRAYECSICGVAVVGNHHHFCPNCGADMRKGADDEDSNMGYSDM